MSRTTEAALPLYKKYTWGSHITWPNTNLWTYAGGARAISRHVTSAWSVLMIPKHHHTAWDFPKLFPILSFPGHGYWGYGREATYLQFLLSLWQYWEAAFRACYIHSFKQLSTMKTFTCSCNCTSKRAIQDTLSRSCIQCPKTWTPFDWHPASQDCPRDSLFMAIACRVLLPYFVDGVAFRCPQKVRRTITTPSSFLSGPDSANMSTHEPIILGGRGFPQVGQVHSQTIEMPLF